MPLSDYSCGHPHDNCNYVGFVFRSVEPETKNLINYWFCGKCGQGGKVEEKETEIH